MVGSNFGVLKRYAVVSSRTNSLNARRCTPKCIELFKYPLYMRSPHLVEVSSTAALYVLYAVRNDIGYDKTFFLSWLAF